MPAADVAELAPFLPRGAFSAEPSYTSGGSEPRSPYASPRSVSSDSGAALTHSRLGIASFVIWVFATLLQIAYVLSILVLGFNKPENIMLPLMIGGASLCSGLLLNCIGAALGAVGLAVSHNKQVFTWVGMLLNAAVWSCSSG